MKKLLSPEELYRSPNVLAQYYTRFRVDRRYLLTGHSHQAWPDRGFEGQMQAWLDAAEFLDRKWEYAFAKSDLVRKGFSGLLEDAHGYIALGPSTHDLLIRFLSALPLRKRPRIVTTDGEFHSIRRQLDRLGEEGIEVVKVPSDPADGLAERLIGAVDGNTSAVMVSAVLYQSGRIVFNLGDVQDACLRVGCELLVDAYHAVNVVPFSLRKEGLERSFIVGGGYKYCQLGEGNCFLRFPEDCRMRPIVTGWFSEFDELAFSAKGDAGVLYGRGASRFAGSTYDPTSHYRAAEVFAFFNELDLSPEFLRRVSLHQLDLLLRLFDAMDADPRLIARDRSVPLESLGGFIVLRSQRAEEFCRLLSQRGVEVDFRGDALRLGPAPYLTDRQLTEAMHILREVIQSLR